MDRKRNREQQQATLNRSRRFRRRHVVLAALALLLAAFFAAPILVAKTGLRNSLVNWALSDLEAEIQIGSASLNWFTVVELRDVRLVDTQGKVLAEVDQIASEKPLLALLGNHQQLGSFKVQGPRVSIEIRQGGSNLEDALSTLLEPEQSETAAIQFVIDIVGGEVSLARKGFDTPLKVSEISAKVTVDSESKKPVTVVVAGASHGQQNDGRFETELSSTTTSTDISIATERLPLALCGLAMLRLGTDAVIGGDLDADVDLTLAPGKKLVLTIRRFSARQVTIESPQWLGQDRLSLEMLEASGRTEFADGTLKLDQCNLTSDIALLEANGTFDTAGLASGNVVQLMGDKDFRVEGKVDLGRLANMLPNTLSLKDNTRITGGSVELNTFSRVEADRRRWVATLGTTAVTAVSAGRKISWDQPLQVTLVAADSGNGPAIETLVCRSDFLTAEAKGTVREGSLTANGNLDRLAEQLGRFIDLSKIQLAGGLSATAKWQQQSDRRVRFVGNVVLSSFALSTPAGTPWTEERLTLDGDVLIAADSNGVKQLDNGQIVLRAGDDHLELRLAAPRQLDNKRSPWPVSAVLQGELATWIPRLQPWISLSSWKASGRVSLEANGQIADELLRIQNAELKLVDFQLNGDGVHIREPQVIVQASGSWSMAERRLALKQSTLTSSTVALQTDAASARFGKATEFTGDLAYRCDLARLASCFRDPLAKAPETAFAGHVTGNVGVRFHKRLLDATLKAQVHDFSLLKRDVDSFQAIPVANGSSDWQNVWHEKLMKIDGDASFDLARGNLQLRSARIAGTGLALDARGTLSDIDKTCTANLRGTIDYDLPKVSRALQAVLGPNVEFMGREQGSFTIKGPLLVTRSVEAKDAGESARPSGLVANELSGEAQFGWAAANLFGFPIGKGSLTANLREGVVDFQPLRVAVGTGRIDLTPHVYLNGQPATLVVDNGRVLENVQITPEISRGWLKFVAPIVADATEAQGTFSLDVSGAKVPLAAPSRGNVRGTLHIRRAAIGPGAMGRELLVLGQQIQGLIRGQALNSLVGTQTAQWVQMPEQHVAFYLVDGRVYHEKLQLVVGDVGITTSGSVGLDQSVDLIARVAIRDSWVADNRLLAGLKGKTLEIPIKGTLSRPLGDSRVVANVARQYFRGTAERAVEREIQKGLERGLQQLFGPPR